MKKAANVWAVVVLSLILALVAVTLVAAHNEKVSDALESDNEMMASMRSMMEHCEKMMSSGMMANMMSGMSQEEHESHHSQ